MSVSVLLWHCEPFAVAVLLGTACLCGAAPERLLAGALFVATVVDIACGPALRPEVGSALTMHVFFDVLLFASIVAVALHANRMYPLWLGAAQIATLVAHFAQATLRLAPSAYTLMATVPFYIQALALLFGLLFHAARVQRLRGTYPSWIV